MPMMRFEKVVGSLPATLTPDTLYMVRTGAGFDLYVSDATGSIAHPVNGGIAEHTGRVAWPKRATPRIIGDAAGTALATLALNAARQVFIPFVVPRTVELTGLRISVTTASAGPASMGIYANATVSGLDAPGALLAGAEGVINTGTTGDKTADISYTLQPGQIYWASLIASAAATVRAIPTAARDTGLGRQVNGTGVIAYLYAAGSGSTLPATAPETLTNGTGSTPAIYMIE
jgi:hypothetical protein